MRCEVCKCDVSEIAADCYLLTQEELTASPAFWAAVFREAVEYIEGAKEVHEQLGSSGPSPELNFEYTLANVCEGPGLQGFVCANCIRLFPDVDRGGANAHARAWDKKKGPGGGYRHPERKPVDPSSVREVAAEGYRAATGRKPAGASRCFMATAAQGAVKLYESLSPPVARVVARSRALRRRVGQVAVGSVARLASRFRRS